MAERRYDERHGVRCEAPHARNEFVPMMKRVFSRNLDFPVFRPHWKLQACLNLTCLSAPENPISLTNEPPIWVEPRCFCSVSGIGCQRVVSPVSKSTKPGLSLVICLFADCYRFTRTDSGGKTCLHVPHMCSKASLPPLPASPWPRAQHWPKP